MVSALIIGGVVCTALSVAGGFITDLKIGYWIGTTPKKQETWKFLGVTLSAATVGGVIIILNQTYGFKGEGAMVAPQANAMAAVIQPLMSNTPAPWMLYMVGAVIALILTMVEIPPLAFALGMYIPQELNTPLLFGGLVAWWVTSRAQRREAQQRALLAGDADRLRVHRRRRAVRRLLRVPEIPRPDAGARRDALDERRVGGLVGGRGHRPHHVHPAGRVCDLGQHAGETGVARRRGSDQGPGGTGSRPRGLAVLGQAGQRRRVSGQPPRAALARRIALSSAARATAASRAAGVVKGPASTAGMLSAQSRNSIRCSSPPRATAGPL